MLVDAAAWLLILVVAACAAKLVLIGHSPDEVANVAERADEIALVEEVEARKLDALVKVPKRFALTTVRVSS